MSLASNRLLAAASGGATDVLYSDDVFSAFTRAGTGADVTVTTGIDMTKGYMLWSKGRSGATDHAIYDSARGVTLDLASNTTAAQTTQAAGLKAVSATGHTVGSLAKMNTNGATYVDFVFKKAPKFFDVVTYTGNGANRTIAHALGAVPGMIIIKRTDAAADWQVYHNGIANTEYMVLNTTAAKATGATRWNSTTPTASVFSLGTDTTVNANVGTYVAYLFAHDTSAGGLIQCGSFNNSSAYTVNLGWEPQYVLFRLASGIGVWRIVDSSRGFNLSGNSITLSAESNGAEGSSNIVVPSATGFFGAAGAGGDYIYLAIRRPNKPPTLGTQVYSAIARTGTGAAATVTGVGFAPDLVIAEGRGNQNGAVFYDKLRGVIGALRSDVASAEYTADSTAVTSFNMSGISLGADSFFGRINQNTMPIANWFFKRAPGVFDIVCWTATGTPLTVSHGLGAIPELMIVKNRSAATWNWAVYAAPEGATKRGLLNSTNIFGVSTAMWNNTAPTATAFTVGTGDDSNPSNGATMVTYLFASRAGISKVGSYTGNGSTQTIDAGFTTGARFVMIKRTDSTGDWYTWDTARGLVAGNDPHLSLNTTAAEVTTNDSLDPANAGFIVNQLAATNINVTSATYIYLAFA